MKHGKWDIFVTKLDNFRWQADAVCPSCNFTKRDIWSAFFPGVPDDIAESTTNEYVMSIQLPNYCERCGMRLTDDA